MIIPPQCQEWARLHRPQGDYLTELEAEWAILEPHLPQTVSSIVDIGCGLAGIDVYLKRRYPNAKLTLLDSDGGKPQYGFKSVCRPYGNRRLAETLLAANATAADLWLPAGYPDLICADLIISLISWGFHYPLSTYNVQGTCIADLRKDHEPARGIIIADTPRYRRCLFHLQKPPSGHAS